MVKTQYLNEEKYQKNKKNITKIAILVLILGLLVGGALIVTGLIKNNQAKLSMEEINQIQEKIDNYKAQLSSLKSQQYQELKANGFSENYYNLDNQIDKVEDKIDVLEDELYQDTSHSVIFYILGGFVVLVTLMASSSIYVTAKGREIIAFYAQQQMPVTKEGIKEITPTVADAAEEITKKIKKGLKDKE